MTESYWKDYFLDTAKRDNVHRQVGRTVNKKPISKKMFNIFLKYVAKNIDIKPTDLLLDLCCGNGLITSYMAERCKLAIGVDFTEKLISELNKNKRTNNIIGIVDDITKIKFNDESFNKIIICFSIQHFTQEQTVRVFKSVYKWLKKGGTFYIGDVPDRDRIWNFFSNSERESLYFNGIENDRPIIGTFYNKDFLMKLAKYAKFKESKIIDQPKEFLYSHYRFDMILKK